MPLKAAWSIVSIALEKLVLQKNTLFKYLVVSYDTHFLNLLRQRKYCNTNGLLNDSRSEPDDTVFRYSLDHFFKVYITIITKCRVITPNLLHWIKIMKLRLGNNSLWIYIVFWHWHLTDSLGPWTSLVIGRLIFFFPRFQGSECQQENANVLLSANL